MCVNCALKDMWRFRRSSSVSWCKRWSLGVKYRPVGSGSAVESNNLLRLRIFRWRRQCWQQRRCIQRSRNVDAVAAGSRCCGWRVFTGVVIDADDRQQRGGHNTAAAGAGRVRSTGWGDDAVSAFVVANINRIPDGCFVAAGRWYQHRQRVYQHHLGWLERHRHDQLSDVRHCATRDPTAGVQLPAWLFTVDGVGACRSRYTEISHFCPRVAVGDRRHRPGKSWFHVWNRSGSAV